MSSSGDIITNVSFSGAGNSLFNCGILPRVAPITCTGGVISTSGILEVTASNAGFTGSATQAYVIETIQPTAVIFSINPIVSPTSLTGFILNLVFSEVITGSVVPASFSLVNALVSGISTIDNITYTLTLTRIAD